MQGFLITELERRYYSRDQYILNKCNKSNQYYFTNLNLLSQVALFTNDTSMGENKHHQDNIYEYSPVVIHNVQTYSYKTNYL